MQQIFQARPLRQQASDMNLLLHHSLMIESFTKMHALRLTKAFVGIFMKSVFLCCYLALCYAILLHATGMQADVSVSVSV